MGIHCGLCIFDVQQALVFLNFKCMKYLWHHNARQEDYEGDSRLPEN